MSIEDLKAFREEIYSKIPEVELSINMAFDYIGFTDEYVTHKIRNVGQASKKNKVIKDGIWGIVELDYTALRLLDSPLLQRLRGIKQLGFSYLTYPTAEHSRFSHSLGTYSVVYQLIHVMGRYSDYRFNHGLELGTAEIWHINQNHDCSYDLLHAAILHDVGHMPFSHASEKAIIANKKDFWAGAASVHKLLGMAGDFLGEKVSLSETISLLVLFHPRFINFYNNFVHREANNDAI